MERKGIKHVIQCRCFLQQHLNTLDPPFFSFPVFSILENDVVSPKTVQCINCGILHKVTDLNKSSIQPREESKAISSIEDVKVSLPEDLKSILENYDIDLPTYEFVKFIMQEKAWGSSVTLTNEEVDGRVEGKYLVIYGEKLFDIQTYESERYVLP